MAMDVGSDQLGMLRSHSMWVLVGTWWANGFMPPNLPVCHNIPGQKSEMIGYSMVTPAPKEWCE